MLTLHDVSFAYPGGAPVLEHCSFTCERGARVWIRGVSGRGKTTLFRLIAGLETPTHGAITLQPGCSVSMVFQEDRLLPWKTAKENVMLVSDAETAAYWLSAFGLEDVMDVYPPALSGGMNRRVALARAVAAKGEVLLLDEAFQGIDPARVEQIFALLKKECADRCILFADHDEAQGSAFATQTIDL